MQLFFGVVVYGLVMLISGAIMGDEFKPIPATIGYWLVWVACVYISNRRRNLP